VAQVLLLGLKERKGRTTVAALLWTIFVILVIAWALGFFIVHLGTFIHILIVLAVIALIWNLVTGGLGARRGTT
jgi:uncharacterized membrane protein